MFGQVSANSFAELNIIETEVSKYKTEIFKLK